MAAAVATMPSLSEADAPVLVAAKRFKKLLTSDLSENEVLSLLMELPHLDSIWEEQDSEFLMRMSDFLSVLSFAPGEHIIHKVQR